MRRQGESKKHLGILKDNILYLNFLVDLVNDILVALFLLAYFLTDSLNYFKFLDYD